MVGSEGINVGGMVGMGWIVSDVRWVCDRVGGVNNT